MVDYKEIGPIFPFLYQMQQNCILLSAFSASAQQKSNLGHLKKSKNVLVSPFSEKPSAPSLVSALALKTADSIAA